jgi:hypothetical protein
MWASVSRSAPRLADDRRHAAPKRAAAARVRQPQRLKRLDLELPDGRYLLAYERASGATDA